MEKKRISIKEAATVLGVSEQFLRVWLRDENPPFGKAVKMSPKRWTYYINQKRLDQYVAGENESDDQRGKKKWKN